VLFDDRIQRAGVIGIVMSQHDRFYRNRRLTFIEPIDKRTSYRSDIDDNQFARRQPDNSAITLSDIPKINLQ
jgi:hypothetical protein